MSGHTPGPWHFEPAAEIGKPYAIFGYGVGPHKNYIAVLQHAIDSSENIPNALILSAAPELLKACIQARGLFRTVLGEEVDLPVSAQNETKISVLRTRIESLNFAIGLARGEL